MNTDSFKKICNEVIFAAFLMRFLPGIVLLASVNVFVHVRVRGGLFESLLVLSVAWTFGLLLEQFTFGSYRENHLQPADFRSTVPLFFANLGIAFLGTIILVVINVMIEHGDIDRVSLNEILRLLLFMTIGLIFLLKGMQLMRKHAELPR